MTAEINGMKWSAEREWFQLDYMHDLGYHATDIFSDTEILTNGVYYSISIHHSYYPQKGRIYFNNTDTGASHENGASASIHGWLKPTKDDFYSISSISGFVEITEIKRSSMKGYFEFDATSPYYPELGTVRVTKGTFFVPLTLVGSGWDGKYKE
jgi:hypothetical protein